MYAVIFKAEIAQLDDEYLATASRLRELAHNEFGCLDFVSTTEGNTELAISYWPSLEQITNWRNHPEHREAQEKGRSLWYSDYQVHVTEVLSDYRKSSIDESSR